MYPKGINTFERGGISRRKEAPEYSVAQGKFLNILWSVEQHFVYLTNKRSNVANELVRNCTLRRQCFFLKFPRVSVIKPGCRQVLLNVVSYSHVTQTMAFNKKFNFFYCAVPITYPYCVVSTENNFV